MKNSLLTLTLLGLTPFLSGQSINVTPAGVGIGTTAPGNKLHVAGPAGFSYQDGALRLQMSNDDLYFYRPSENRFAIQTTMDGAGIQWSSLSLQPDGGNVGIGTTTPTAPLEVAGDVVAKAQVFRGYMTTDFSKPAGWGKLPFNAVAFNTLTGVFDTANGLFTPSRSGYYQVTVNGFSSTGSNAGDHYAFALVKNGGFESITGGQYNAVDTPLSPFSGIVYLNGTGDCIEIWMYSAIAATLKSGSAGYGMQWHMSYLGK